LAVGVAIAAAVLVPVLVFTVGGDSQAWPGAALSLDREWKYVVPGDGLSGYFLFSERCFQDCPVLDWAQPNGEEAMNSELYSSYFRSPLVSRNGQEIVGVSLLGSPPPLRAYFYSLPFEIGLDARGGLVQAGTIRGYPAVAVWYTSPAFGDGFQITVLERLPVEDKPGIYTSVPAAYSALDTPVAQEIVDGRNRPE
jgi:hypothetical protein